MRSGSTCQCCGATLSVVNDIIPRVYPFSWGCAANLGVSSPHDGYDTGSTECNVTTFQFNDYQGTHGVPRNAATSPGGMRNDRFEVVGPAREARKAAPSSRGAAIVRSLAVVDARDHAALLLRLAARRAARDVVLLLRLEALLGALELLGVVQVRLQVRRLVGA